MTLKTTARRLCSTAEAARLTGYSQRHINLLARRKEIYSEQLSARFLLVDRDQIERLAKERDRLRAAGQMAGKPRGAKTA